jgi:thymidylate kinase
VDELAKLYVSRNGKTYRLKVFAQMVGIERQPDGENVLLDRSTRSTALYNAGTQAWNYEAIGELIARYEVGTLCDVQGKWDG